MPFEETIVYFAEKNSNIGQRGLILNDEGIKRGDTAFSNFL